MIYGPLLNQDCRQLWSSTKLLLQIQLWRCSWQLVLFLFFSNILVSSRSIINSVEMLVTDLSYWLHKMRIETFVINMMSPTKYIINTFRNYAAFGPQHPSPTSIAVIDKTACWWQIKKLILNLQKLRSKITTSKILAGWLFQR